MLFSTVIGVSGTLIASGIVDKILVHKGKEPLAETLRLLTHTGAVAYGGWFLYHLISKASLLFL